MTDSYYWIFRLVAGGAVAKSDPESTGLNPAWRKALIHTVAGAGWADDAPLEEIEAAKESKGIHWRIRKACAEFWCIL